MARDPKSLRRAAAIRDAAAARVRRVTAAAVALAAGLTGVFTAMAAQSTHPRRATTLPGPVAPARRTTTTRPVVAPAPPLVPVRGSGGASTPQPQPQPQPQPSAPAPAPAPVPAPAPAATPVVVSGGS